MITLTDCPIDVARVTDSVCDHHAGAVLLFLGTVRDLTGTVATESLEYDAYHSMALRSMEELQREALTRFPVTHVSICHRIGHLQPGDVSVAIAVSAPHRRAAFQAGEWLIDTLKERVPIWKKEHHPDGASAWVHPQTAPGSRSRE